MEIPFISPNVFEGHYPINWYYQKEGFNGRPTLTPTPGLLEWCDTGHYAPVRGAAKLNTSVMYSVVGNKVFSHDAFGVTHECTGVLNTLIGTVQMASNGTYMMIVDGFHGYYVLGNVVAEIADADFPIPSSLTYQDGYFIITEKGFGRYYISALNDPTSWNALDYANAEGLPDNGVRVFMDHRELLNFQEESIEPYQNTGNADFPFQRIEGAFIETGLYAKDSVAKLDNSVCWLADDFSIKRMVNYTPVVIGPENLSRIIGAYTVKSDAFAFSYKDSGNAFYAITFPTANATWVYNAATNAFHQWSSGMTEGRHRSNCHCFFGGKNLVGDMENGKIYELSNSTYTDDGETIRRKRISPPLYDPEQRSKLTYPKLEVEFKAGVGLLAGQGSDPQAMLRYSDDNCRTWSNEKWRSIGQIGKYKDRAIWHKLGSSRVRNFEISMSDPVDATIVNAYSPVIKNEN